LTSYSDVYDLFLQRVQDYTLNALYVSSTPLFEARLQGWLINAIPNFQGCLKDLEDRNDTTFTFNTTLTTTEKVILSKLMLIEWWETQINDIRQIMLHINVSEAKHYAEGQNLKEKKAAQIADREDADRLITRYGYGNLSLSSLE
jgi:hypothetical protein